MPLPTLEKTWQYSTNNIDVPAGTALENFQRAMFRVKAILVGFATAPWVVLASSNGVVANTSDNWTSFASCVFAATGARSWIVLRQAGVAANYQMLIDLTGGASGSLARFKISPSAGFTGLTSTSTVPAATDEYTIRASTWFGNLTNTPFKSIVHGQMSSDGEKTRIILAAQGNSKSVLVIDKLSNPVTGMTNPTFAVLAVATTGGVSATTVDAVNGSAIGVGRDATVNLTYYMTTEGYNATTVSAALSTNPNQISGEYPLTGIGVASPTVGKTGRHGRLSDIWFGSAATAITDGSTYPAGVARTFIQCGQLVLPWDGSAPVFL
jgi:hypothetical protein